jgi:NDP-sugar pyrophosphorylase family protein
LSLGRGRDTTQICIVKEVDSVREATGIVLAGVHRWDDSEFDQLLPWPLMPVIDSPLICHSLAWLRAGGIRQATICANSDSRQVRRVLTDGVELGIDIEHFEDWTPRGPAGCIRDAGLQTDAERFVVVEGTILPEYDLLEVLRQHARSGSAMTVVASREPEGSNGIVERLVPAGIYVVDRSVLEHIPETGYQDIKEVLLPRLYEQKVSIRTHTLAQPCCRITNPGSYVEMNARALERLGQSNLVPPGYGRFGQAIVHESARVASPDTLFGTILIGPRTTIAAGTTLVGPTVIGANCTVESAAAVCNSVLWDGCCVGRGAAVNHCLLGDTVTVKAEAVLVHAVFAGPASHHRFRPTAKLESLLFPLPGEEGYEYALLEGSLQLAALLKPHLPAGSSAGAAST